LLQRKARAVYIACDIKEIITRNIVWEVLGDTAHFVGQHTTIVSKGMMNGYLEIGVKGMMIIICESQVQDSTSLLVTI